VADNNKEATRDRYGVTLAELAREDRNVVAMDCDLGRSTRSYNIAGVDPNRFIEMGIAEQDMISTAAGMARCGKIVFVNSFAIFITGRAFDQIRQQIALPSSNVKLCGSSAGLTQGPDGATHQSLLDVALMRMLPNMTVAIPADGNQTEQIIRTAYRMQGPIYIRLSRYATPSVINDNISFELGKAQVIREGSAIAFATYGPVLSNVLAAADELQKQGIEAGLVNFHTIKPVDVNFVESMAEKYRYIFSVEEHSIYGGLGSALAEIMAGMQGSSKTATLLRIGVQDTFGESGTADELLKKHGLDSGGIMHSVQQYVGEKGERI